MKTPVEGPVSVLRSDPSPRCQHCGDKIPDWRMNSQFCCSGCAAVFQILGELGQNEFYDLRKKGRIFRLPQAVRKTNEDYQYVDQLEGWSSSNEKQFFVEGIHCTACLWLLERLPYFAKEVIEARLDLGTSVLTVKKTDSLPWSEVASTIQSIGYRPHPLISEQSRTDFGEKERRELLIRLGVAAVCTGNMMILSVALYSGASGLLGRLFSWSSFALCLPVVFYSAQPFFKTAWRGIRARRPSIDLPIALAIVAATMGSVYSLATGSGEIYFDSVSALIFLLLASRYLLLRIRQKVFESSHFQKFRLPTRVKKIANNEVQEITPEFLKENDLLKFEAGDFIPCDGRITKGSGLLDESSMTGESLPISVGESDEVTSGSVLISGDLEVLALNVGKESRMGRILNRIETELSQRSRWINLTDRISRFFVATVILVSVLSFIAFTIGEVDGAFSRVLAFVILSCPCALALATPLSVAMGLSAAAKKGILIKDGDAIERASSIRRIVLDKTGTLTEAQFKVVRWHKVDSEVPDRVVFENLYALEMESKHPVAGILTRFASEQGPLSIPKISNWGILKSGGVTANIRDEEWAIESIDREREGSKRDLGLTLELKRGRKAVALFYLEDRLRDASIRVIGELNDSDFETEILSGDRISNVERVSRSLGIQKFKGEADPEEKVQYLKSIAPVAMVGDGANDAAALASATFGVSVRGGVESSLKASDAYLANGIEDLPSLFGVAQSSMRTIKRNLAFSIAYNILGGVAALSGLVHPLFAAVLMPLSSLTVLVSSTFAGRGVK